LIVKPLANLSSQQGNQRREQARLAAQSLQRRVHFRPDDRLVHRLRPHLEGMPQLAFRPAARIEGAVGCSSQAFARIAIAF
jgi:hypothetical protein